MCLKYEPGLTWPVLIWPDLAHLRSGQGPTWPNGRDATVMIERVTVVTFRVNYGGGSCWHRNRTSRWKKTRKRFSRRRSCNRFYRLCCWSRHPAYSPVFDYLIQRIDLAICLRSAMAANFSTFLFRLSVRNHCDVVLEAKPWLRGPNLYPWPWLCPRRSRPWSCKKSCIDSF